MNWQHRLFTHPLNGYSLQQKTYYSPHLPAIRQLTVILLCCYIFLHGCTNLVKVPERITEPGIPNPPSVSLASSQPDYIIQPGDTLDIKFYYSTHLNDTVTVRPDGRISLQLVHDSPAASLTPTELTEVLKKKYSSLLKDPEISVIVRSFSSQKVYVDGEVMKPGPVKINGYMTILQAISGAGGLKESSLPDEILVIRRNGLQKPFVLQVNVENARNGTDITQDVKLEPYDIVFVPKSSIANINTWVDLYIRKNIPIDLSYGFFKEAP